MPGYRRTRYIVNRAQARLLTLNVVYYLMFAAVLGVGLWAPLVLGMLDASTPEGKQERIAELLLYLHTRLVPVAILLLVLFGLHSVLVSHRIVGPIYRFTLQFREVGRGNLGGRIRLRQRDYLHEEAAQLNAMLDALSTRLRAIRTSYEELARECRALDESALGNIQGQGQLRLVHALLLRCEAEWAQLDLGPDERVLDENTLDEVPAPLPGDRDPVGAGTGAWARLREEG
jgi:methyl-accepting chemotaxis protein